MDNYTISSGIYGMRRLFHVLFKNDGADIALKMITKKDAPSYRNMIDLGGTALFESFVPSGMNESRNHHMFGDIIHLFISKIAGININPYMSDIHEVLIDPIIPKSLSHAKAWYSFGNEKINVVWKKSDGKTKINVELPEIAHGDIRINGTLVTLKPGLNEFVV